MNFKIFSLTSLVVFIFSVSSFATEIKTTHAVLRALDKITGRTSTIAIEVVPENNITNETDLTSDNIQKSYEVNFGTLTISAKACFRTPPEETPENAVFLQITEKKPREEAVKVFSGWMFSSSPALSAIEHSVYDIWVLKCGNEKEVGDFIEAENKKINTEKAKHLNAEDNVLEPVIDLYD